MILGLLFFGCTPVQPTDEPTQSPAGLLGDHPLNPFPVGILHAPSGHVQLSTEDFPLAGTPLAVDRLSWRSGFSPAQTSVVVLDEIQVQALPQWSTPTPGETGVRLADLTSQSWLPVFAELDAHPENTTHTLLIRPLQAVPAGHTVAVVLTTELTPRSERFDALLSPSPPEDLQPHAPHFAELMTSLSGLGMPPEEVALAWDYPVGDGTLPTRSAWSQITPPTQWSFDEVRTGEDVVPRTYRAAEGTFQTTDFLVNDLTLKLTNTGTVEPTGQTDAMLYIHIPESVADAEPGTVPVMLLGHGIFSTPQRYLNDAHDPSRVVQLLDEAGFIGIATNWRGLTTPDLAGALEAATDFGTIEVIPDRLVQAQANVASLIQLIQDGDLLSDPVFQGRHGQPLANGTKLRYYGISLGGIEGAVMLANDPPLDAVALHVGGSTWSTMLERSSNWQSFEDLLSASVPDALERQRLYAVSQLWWDSVDPIAYTDDLKNRDFLLQISIGDEQVPNLTSYSLARSAQLPLLEPSVEPVWGLHPMQPIVSRGLVQLDPELPLPVNENRPAEVTNAHSIPRTWDGPREQVIHYLQVGTEREIVHRCGDLPCTQSNQGH